MPLKDFLAEAWRMLIGCVQGPMTFRLVIQPLVATLLAVRAGLKDARERRLPYIWSVYFHPATRNDLFREGWADVGKVFLVAVVLDIIYQIIEFRWVYPGQVVIVATLLAIIPYVLFRGPFNRLASRMVRSGSAQPAKPSGGG